MSETPLLTIVVAVYNVEAYITECLQSIADQTFEDFECIIIDDGTPDSSGAIADAFAAKDSRFRVVHQENRGVGGTRNAGLTCARTPYIAFVDGDDFCAPDLYAELVRVAQATDAPIVVCDYFDYYDNDGSSAPVASACGAFDNVTEDTLDERAYWTAFYKEDLLALVYTWNKIYKRELFDTLSYEERTPSQDNAIALRLAQRAGQIALLRKPLYYYRRREGSVTLTSRPGHYLHQCAYLVERGEYFAQKGWQDIWDENALYLMGRVARTRAGMELRSEEDQRLYAEYRAEARRQARSLLRRRWREKRFVTRVVPFLLGENVYMRFAG